MFGKFNGSRIDSHQSLWGHLGFLVMEAFPGFTGFSKFKETGERFIKQSIFTLGTVGVTFQVTPSNE